MFPNMAEMYQLNYSPQTEAVIELHSTLSVIIVETHFSYRCQNGIIGSARRFSCPNYGLYIHCKVSLQMRNIVI